MCRTLMAVAGLSFLSVLALAAEAGLEAFLGAIIGSLRLLWLGSCMGIWLEVEFDVIQVGSRSVHFVKGFVI